MRQDATLAQPGTDRPSQRLVPGWALAAAAWLRPREGWLAVLLLMAHLLVVVWSVTKVEWVQTPNMGITLVLGVASGLVLTRIRIPAILLLPVGLALGFGLIMWQLVAFNPTHSGVSDVGELFSRLDLWIDAARHGTISIDSIPFAFLLLICTWLVGHLSTWSLFRYHRYAGVVILGGVAMAMNLTNIEKAPLLDWMLYVFTAIILLVRVHSVHRQDEWQRRGFEYERKLTWLSLSDGLWFAGAILLLAYLLPYSQGFRPLNGLYNAINSPTGSLSADFDRLFAGLPGKKPRPYRDFSHVLPLRGTIKNTTNPVLQVVTPYPLYWKVRSYSVYTSKGWIMGDTAMQLPGWTPELTVEDVDYRERLPVTHRVTSIFANKNIFTGGQVLEAPRANFIETYDAPAFVLDLRQPGWQGLLPPGAEGVGDLVALASEQLGRGEAEVFLQQRLPYPWSVESVERPLDSPEVFTLRLAVPASPEVLYLHPGSQNLKPNETYSATASVSFATDDQLRGAGDDYPAWALARYLQLPDTLPSRVVELAQQLTSPLDTAFDKAKAIENYLETFTYTREISPPPFNADGVDFFLFDSQQGYSEYFGSAMTVLLRAAGIPARLATGYNQGEQTEEPGTYIVRDNDSHAWTEVFFPEYGWSTFEPTPGRTKPQISPPILTGVARPSGVPLDFTDELLEEDELFLDAPFGGGGALLDEEGSGQYLWLLLLLLIPVALWVVWQLLWYQFMRPSLNPEIAFRRLAFLGGLGGLSPNASQTPHQYRDRLLDAFPTMGLHLSVVVDTYVRTIYGRKELNDTQKAALATTWVQLRGQLLLRIFRRG